MSVKSIAIAAAKAVPIMLCDLCGLAGIAAIVHGVAMWSEPAAWIVGGLALFAAAVFWARR